MAKTLAEQLDSVQTAIETIETKGQSISMEGRTYTRADLSSLYTREERLLSRIARESNGTRTLAEF